MKTFKKLTSLTLVACSLCFALTGCGNNDNGSTSGNNDSNVTNDTTNNAGDAAGDLVEGAGNAVEDVADGVGNAVDDLVGTNGFDNYDDAHDYFLETMENYHSDAEFEVREEDQNLVDYQEGSKGYHFKLYDTSKNTDGELFGEFYVDATTGMIYKVDGDTVTEYRGTDANTNASNQSRSAGNAGNDAGADMGTGAGTDTGAGNSSANGSGTDANGGNGTAGNTTGGTAGAAQ